MTLTFPLALSCINQLINRINRIILSKLVHVFFILYLFFKMQNLLRSVFSSDVRIRSKHVRYLIISYQFLK